MNSILHIISILAVASGFLCALAVAGSIFSRRRQPMRIMEAVWPLTGLGRAGSDCGLISGWGIKKGM